MQIHLKDEKISFLFRAVDSQRTGVKPQFLVGTLKDIYFHKTLSGMRTRAIIAELQTDTWRSKQNGTAPLLLETAPPKQTAEFVLTANLPDKTATHFKDTVRKEMTPIVSDFAEERRSFTVN